MTKGLQKPNSFTNIKNITTGVIITTLNNGDSVYGTLSTTGTDLIDFDHIWRNDVTIFQLDVQCKASVGNLTLSNVAEPTNPTPVPPVNPPTTPTITHNIQVNSLGQISIDGGAFS